MSKIIEVPEDLSTLSEEDAKYLHDRGRITDEQLAEVVGESEATVAEALKTLSQPASLDDTPNTGDANTAGVSKEQHEKNLARMAAEQGSDDESEALVEEPYDDANNEDLRAELARRGLSVSGKKDELVDRLREDDESTEE